MSLALENRSTVYGEVYDSAKTQMDLLNADIRQHIGIGFQTIEEIVKWAHDHHLDLRAYSHSHKMMYFVSHHGELITKAAYQDYYCKDVLFWWDEDNKGHKKKVYWMPEGFDHVNNARVYGEQESRNRKPLLHRDYYTPTGFYDMERGTFNIAKPFPYPAKQTGADTSHIYTYIQHIGGECAMWLLAWLRFKLCNPTDKTQVTPIIISKEQGSGKTTFAEVICKGLFGKDNVLVTDQYDSSARFNSDSADALIVCQEERQQEDVRNPASAIKSRITATTIRKELKGIDPIVQDSYQEFIMTTNDDVPIKFGDDTRQRRFMVMEADGEFTRSKSQLADEVFTKLYGKDGDGNETGIPFVEDGNLIAQFKHELFTDEDVKKVCLREFPETPAYSRCYTMPRTLEHVEIMAIIRSLMPFVKASLEAGEIVVSVKEGLETLALTNLVPTVHALQFIKAGLGKPDHIAVCRSLVFIDSNNRPYKHAVVEKVLYDISKSLRDDYGIDVIPEHKPLLGGFMGIQGRHRNAVAALFKRAGDVVYPRVPEQLRRSVMPSKVDTEERIGKRLRVNGQWRPDPDGEFETVNELKPGVETLSNKTKNVQYMDTFLFEADEVSKSVYVIEQNRLKFAKNNEIRAEALYAERLKLQRHEAERLFRSGAACRVVYSGGKSVHVLVRVSDAPKNTDEYEWLHAHLCIQLSEKLTYDPVCHDPARLTRAPITFEREDMIGDIKVKGTQSLIYVNYNNVLDIAWRPLYEQWLNRPLTRYEQNTGRKLRPCKKEYYDAMGALLEGTFFTDSQWNGRRQQCFFPAYRLCRMLGYTHDQLWASNGILDGLSAYYRPNEINYWETRESCELILTIDKEADDDNVS